MLTAARSGEVAAQHGSRSTSTPVNGRAAVRMKAKRSTAFAEQGSHSDPGELGSSRGVKLGVPSPRGGHLSDMTLSAVMRRMEVDAVPHGLRSTFRDWCASTPILPNDMAEMALATCVGDRVEAASGAASCSRSGADDGEVGRVPCRSSGLKSAMTNDENPKGQGEDLSATAGDAMPEHG